MEWRPWLDTLISSEALERVQEDFLVKGLTVTTWARENQFSKELVYAVMSGRAKARRGQSHAIAVRLGLIKSPLSEPEKEKETTPY